MKNNSNENKLIIIYSFYTRAEAVAVRCRLESEGIECWLLDELIAQVYSSITGVRLQIRERDIQKVTAILEELGYGNDNNEPSQTESKLRRITSKIPILNKMRFELRLMIIAAVIVAMIIIAVYLALLPSTFDRLTKQHWDLEYVIYDGKKYSPNTISIINLLERDWESISLRSNGTIVMPGFESHAVWGKWALDGKSLVISESDSFDFLYDGIYKIEFAGKKLILKSERTTIYCRQR